MPCSLGCDVTAARSDDQLVKPADVAELSRILFATNPPRRLSSRAGESRRPQVSESAIDSVPQTR